MEAVQLAETVRGVLARAGGVPEIMAGAWQAQALAEAVGRHLAARGPAVLRDASLALAETGSRAGEALRPSGGPGGEAAAGRLTGIADPAAALRALRELLHEAGAALVAVVCTAEEESAYWCCVDAVDAADEAKERVAELLRLLDGPAEEVTD